MGACQCRAYTSVCPYLRGSHTESPLSAFWSMGGEVSASFTVPPEGVRDQMVRQLNGEGILRSQAESAVRGGSGPHYLGCVGVRQELPLVPWDHHQGARGSPQGTGGGPQGTRAPLFLGRGIHTSRYQDELGGVEGVIEKMGPKNRTGKRCGWTYCGPKIMGRAPRRPTHPCLSYIALY